MQSHASPSRALDRRDLAMGASTARCPTCAAVYSGDAVHCPADGTPLVGDDMGTPQNPLRLLPKAGSLIHGYRLLEVLGEGSMGRVYLAEHERIGRTVAIKMLHPALLRSRIATQQFINEARTVNRIGHRNIIEITDFVETGNGSGCFLVMERLDGCSLEQVLKQSASLSVARSLHIGRQICEGLDAAHAVGVVHRDLKPGNVFLLDREGDTDFAKLIDFGVAKVQRYASQRIAREVGTPESGVRYVIGTPAYMSPEQSYDEEVDARSDVYSVGVLLYEMVTGRLPFGGDSLGELLDAHRFAQPTPPSTRLGLREPIPPRLDELILQCMAKRPEERPATMAMVGQTLREIEAEQAAMPNALQQIIGGQDAAAAQATFAEGRVDRAFLESRLIRWFDEEPNWAEEDLWADEQESRGSRRRWPVLLTLTAMLGALVFAGLVAGLAERSDVAFMLSSAHSGLAASSKARLTEDVGRPEALPAPGQQRIPVVAPTPPQQAEPVATSAADASRDASPMVTANGEVDGTDSPSPSAQPSVAEAAPEPVEAAIQPKVSDPSRVQPHRVAKRSVAPLAVQAPVIAAPPIHDPVGQGHGDHAEPRDPAVAEPPQTDPSPTAAAPVVRSAPATPTAKAPLKLPNWAGKGGRAPAGARAPSVRKPSWAD